MESRRCLAAAMPVAGACRCRPRSCSRPGFWSICAASVCPSPFEGQARRWHRQQTEQKNLGRLLTRPRAGARYVNVFNIHIGRLPMSCAARSDEWGRYPPMNWWTWHPGWIVLMVLGFIFWWPVGLAILAFTLWSRKMGCWGGHGYDHWQEKMERMRAKMERF